MDDLISIRRRNNGVSRALCQWTRSDDNKEMTQSCGRIVAVRTIGRDCLIIFIAAAAATVGSYRIAKWGIRVRARHKDGRRNELLF